MGNEAQFEKKNFMRHNNMYDVIFHYKVEYKLKFSYIAKESKAFLFCRQFEVLVLIKNQNILKSTTVFVQILVFKLINYFFFRNENTLKHKVSLPVLLLLYISEVLFCLFPVDITDSHARDTGSKRYKKGIHLSILKCASDMCFRPPKGIFIKF